MAKKFPVLFLTLALLLPLSARADTPSSAPLPPSSTPSSASLPPSSTPEPHPLSASVDAKSALLMEKTTGQILYEHNSHEKLEPASVTKIMTLLLTFEALDENLLTFDTVLTTSAHAASMGGSQIFLKENESMTVRDLIKAVAVVSANDAATLLAEGIAGSEEAFVRRMNDRAKALGMNDTTFLNCTGLPADGHLTSAYDIALMSRELILNHPEVREFTTIWLDSLRDGQFQLSNTNKLVRFYDGATGLKTGFTTTARYCLSATAEKDGMELIAVVLGCESSQNRFENAKTMLNYGFSNYTLASVSPTEALPPLKVVLGESETVQPIFVGETKVLVEKSKVSALTTRIELPEQVEAPVEAGAELGCMVVELEGETVARLPLVADKAVPRLTVLGIFRKLTRTLFMAK